MLDGLLKNDRWRICLLSEEAALDFALLALVFAHTRTNSPLHITIMPAFCKMLGAWLSMDAPEYPPDVNTLARQFFGTAWADLVMPNYNQATGVAWHAHIVVRALRPPLLPGLCPAKAPIFAENLPALE
jgi:hypothetical protein